MTKIGRILNPTKKLQGFTLAEVLITLTIIGIVAALTIPTVITNYQKNTYVTQLKKFYTQTNNGLRAYMASQGVTRLSDTELWSKIRAENSNTVNIPDFLSKPALKEEFSKIFKITNIYTESDIQIMYPGLRYTLLDSVNSGDYYNSIVLADGSVITNAYFQKTPGAGAICGTSHNQNCESLKAFQQSERELNLPITSFFEWVGRIEIDVNGFKGPNIFGRDIHDFIVGNDGTLYPVGSLSAAIAIHGASYLEEAAYWRGTRPDYSCDPKSGSVGYGCAARIMEEGWKMNY